MKLRLCAAVTVGAAFLIVVLTAQCAQAQSYSVLYTFRLGPYGAGPYWGVIQDADGNLYGTTSGGGSSDLGSVFKLNATGEETVLYSFKSASTDGEGPASLIRNADGTFYGNTYYGGYGLGTVYKLGSKGEETVLHSFKGGADGAYPQSPLVEDAKGNLYGTTYSYGGPSSAGTIFKIGNTGEFSVLYTFTGGADGNGPSAGLLQDSAGNFYGTTAGGGANSDGVVFKLSSTGHESVLYNFKGGSDGEAPVAPLIRDESGNLYGTTEYGGVLVGQYSCGTVFKVSATGEEAVLHRFTGYSDGCHPSTGLVRDGEGNLYGTTSGTIFKISASGEEAVLYNFIGGADGEAPVSGLIRDAEGNLYGTTEYGGSAPCGSVSDNSGCGVVFKLVP
jgi:uncharacterized repeat protein (TIGR03803 family)